MDLNRAWATIHCCTNAFGRKIFSLYWLQEKVEHCLLYAINYLFVVSFFRRQSRQKVMVSRGRDVSWAGGRGGVQYGGTLRSCVGRSFSSLLVEKVSSSII